jgi:hypothetical protein
MKVRIYQKWFTEEDFEGIATLRRKLFSNDLNNSESWRVRFADGSEVTRSIKLPMKVCKCPTGYHKLFVECRGY